MSDIQVDARAYMATLETTNDPIEMCYSCQRAVLYGAMAYAASVKSQLDQGLRDISRYRPASAQEALISAEKYMALLLKTLAEFCRVDFIGAMEGAEELSQEDWAIAIASFYSARMEHYVDDETGRIKYEPHDADGQPRGDHDGGVTAK